jgi:hypothetical protein
VKGFADTRKLDSQSIKLVVDGRRIDTKEVGGERVEAYTEDIEEGLDDGDQYFYVDAFLEQLGGFGGVERVGCGRRIETKQVCV